MERLLEGISGLVDRAPLAVLLGIAAVTGGFGLGLARLEVSYDPLALLPDVSQVRTFREVEERFGVGSFSHLVAVRFWPREGYAVDDPRAVLEMERVLGALRDTEGIASAEGIPDFVKLAHQELHGGDPRYHTLPRDGCELGYTFGEVIRMAFQRMTLLKRFTSAQGTALATARIAGDQDLVAVARRVEAALAPMRQEAVATGVGSVSYGGTLEVMGATTLRDLRRLAPAVFALILAVLAWAFRFTRPRELALALALVAGAAGLALAPPSALGIWAPVLWALGALALVGIVAWTFRTLSNLYLPVAVVLVAGLWTFGALGLVGVPLNFLMVAVIPLLLGVGIDDAIHMLHRFEEERCRGRAGREAVGISLTRTGRALLLTTLTTTAGFAALSFAPSPPLRQFGLLAILAMLAAFLVTVFLVSAVKRLLGEGPRAEPWPPRGSLRPLAQGFGHPGEGRIGGWLSGYARVARRPAVAVPVLLVGLGLALSGYWEGSAFQTYTVDYRRMLPPGHPIARLYSQVNREFRPYDEVVVRLRGDLARLSVMRLLLKDLPEAVSASPYARKATSIAHVLEDVRAANPQLGRGFLERFEEDPDAAYAWLLRQVLDRESLRGRAAPYLRPLPQGGYEAVVRVNVLRFSDQAGIARVNRDLSARLAPVLAELEGLGVAAQVTGTPLLEEIGLEALRRSFLQSLALSFAFCLAVLALALRSPLWGGLVLFPVVLVVGLVLGSLNALHLELNVATSVVAALSIGLGLDYAIHLVNRLREERNLARAVSRTGEALTAAFFTSSAAFFLLLVSEITWNRDFGVLAGLAIAYAFGATLLFLTPLLALAGRPLAPERAEDRTASGEDPFVRADRSRGEGLR